MLGSARLLAVGLSSLTIAPSTSPRPTALPGRRARLDLIGIAPLVVPLAIAITFAAAPWDVDSKLRLILSGLCAQRPGHSFFVDGAPLPLEARMLGIFCGFLTTTLVSWLAGGWRRTQLPRGWALVVSEAGIGVLGVDGVNALLYDSGLAHLYIPSNELRLLTGLGCGIALAALIAPVLSWAFWRQRESIPLVAGRADLVRTGLVVGGLAVLIMTGAPGRYVLSAVALASATGSFWLVNTYLAAISWQGAGAADDWGDLAWSGAVGILLTAGELVALAALRGWAETSLGITYSF